MNMTELTAEVVAWTNRPDLTANIQSAIRRVTLALHRKHSFWRDLAAVDKTALNQVDSVPLTDFTRFRGLSHVIDKMNGRPLDIVIADDLWDSLTGRQRTNIVFAAGNTLNISLSSASNLVTFYYFQDPDIAAGTYSSWIADTQPDAIISGAVARVLSERGETAISNVAMAAYREEETALLAANNLVEIR
jgi:hypothetical protein